MCGFKHPDICGNSWGGDSGSLLKCQKWFCWVLLSSSYCWGSGSGGCSPMPTSTGGFVGFEEKLQVWVSSFSQPAEFLIHADCSWYACECVCLTLLRSCCMVLLADKCEAPGLVPDCSKRGSCPASPCCPEHGPWPGDRWLCCCPWCWNGSYSSQLQLTVLVCV